MITGEKIILRDKTLADAENDYAWQTDAQLAHLDAARPITQKFRQFLASYSKELRDYASDNKHVYAIETLDGKHIGNCAYYDVNIKLQEAELGIMIGDRRYWGQGYGTDAVGTLLDHIFRETNLRRIYLRTLESNKRAQQCFRKCGFKPYVCQLRDGYSFVFMNVTRRSWLLVRNVKSKSNATQ